MHLSDDVSRDAYQLSPQEIFPSYARRRPEESVLYQTIAEHLETFLALCNGDSNKKSLPDYVRQEFYEFRKCGVLAHGFLRVRCGDCRHEKLVGFSCKRRGFCPSCGGRRMADTSAYLVDEVFPKVPVRQWVLSFPIPLRYLMASNSKVLTNVLAITLRAITGLIRRKARAQGEEGPLECGAVTLVQRFGGSINLNLHFHMLVLEGVFVDQQGEPCFTPVPLPSDEEVRKLVKTLSKRILRSLLRKGYLEGESLAHDPLAESNPLLASCLAASIRYRVALGERAGQRVRKLGTLRECFYEEAELTGSRCAALGGFSLHADTACEAWELDKLERLCRYVARPAIAVDRLSKRSDGLLVYQLKKAYQDGTKYLLFSPEELLEKLAALVPIPRVHLTRFHGCLAPNAKIRAKVVQQAIRRITPRSLKNPGPIGGGAFHGPN